MRSLEQIIWDEMNEAEREAVRAIRTQRRCLAANYQAELEELNKKERVIIERHKKGLTC